MRHETGLWQRVFRLESPKNGLACQSAAPIVAPMSKSQQPELRRGWTTGACAAAATKAALMALWGKGFPAKVGLVLPKGETPEFDLAFSKTGAGWAEAGIIKDAGDDPDVTHGALIKALVEPNRGGVCFGAGEGVGVVTKPGLPVPPGEAAINPVPRQMMTEIVKSLANEYGAKPDIKITVSVPGGAALAAKTWNPRLGIEGGLSILGTTGIVRPFSCSAWIASIHRGIDVARASGQGHVAGCTGATSERIVQGLYALPDHAMLDMGDFAGGMLKYLRKHPVNRLTIGGGIGKMTKLAQGATDLHSKRSQVDFIRLNQLSTAFGLADVSKANTALEAVTLAGKPLARLVADKALEQAQIHLRQGNTSIDVVVIDRAGEILARSGVS